MWLVAFILNSTVLRSHQVSNTKFNELFSTLTLQVIFSMFNTLRFLLVVNIQPCPPPISLTALTSLDSTLPLSPED